MPSEYLRRISQFKDYVLCSAPFVCTVLVVMASYGTFRFLALDSYRPENLLRIFAMKYSADLFAVKMFSSQFAWGISIFIGALAFLTILGTCLIVASRSLDAHSTEKRIALYAIAALFFVVAALFYFTNNDAAPALIAETMALKIKQFGPLINVANYLGIVAVISIAWSACIILLSRRKPDEMKLEHINQQTKYLRILLYISSLYLIAVMFEIRMLYDWLHASLLPATELKKLKPFVIGTISEAKFDELKAAADAFHEAQGVTIKASGVVFTTILTAIFLPASLVLEQRKSSLSVAQGIPVPVVAQGGSIPASLTQMVSLVVALGPLVMGTSLDGLMKIFGSG